jgi:hypothetical protein
MQDRNRSTNDSCFYLPKINPSATSQKDYLLYLPGQRGIACRLTRTPPLICEPLNASRPEPSLVMSAERFNNSTPTLPAVRKLCSADAIDPKDATIWRIARSVYV